MNRKLPNVLLSCLLLTIMLLACAEKKTQLENDLDEEEFMVADFIEPDIYFEQAFGYFEEGDMNEVASALAEVPDFLRTLVFAEDTVHTYLLFDASSKIEQLRKELTAGNVKDESVLYDVFVQVDEAIAQYHLTIVEEFYWIGGDKKEGLERLYRALARIEYAMDYNDFELSEKNEQRLEALREEISKAQRSSPDLWKRVDLLIKEVTKGNDPKLKF